MKAEVALRQHFPCQSCKGTGEVVCELVTCGWCKGSKRERGIIAWFRKTPCRCCGGQGAFWQMVR